MLEMTLRLGSGQAFQVRLRRLPRALGLLRRTAPRNDRRGVPLLAETTPISVLGAYSGDLVYNFAGIQIHNKKGSSGYCVGALQIPPLCKGRQGGVEASRGWTSGGALVRVSRPDLYLPTPSLQRRGTYTGRPSLQRRGLPSEPPTSFQAPTRFPEEPKLVDSTILHVREVEHLSVKQERRLLWP